MMYWIRSLAAKINCIKKNAAQEEDRTEDVEDLFLYDRFEHKAGVAREESKGATVDVRR